MVEGIKLSERKHEAYDQNWILEWAKKRNQASVLTMRTIKIQSFTGRRNETKYNKAYDNQNSILERAKEWN